MVILMVFLRIQYLATYLEKSVIVARSEGSVREESPQLLHDTSDMLEDVLKQGGLPSQLSYSSDFHRLQELSSPISRLLSTELLEQIQAITQNMPQLVERVEQFLRRNTMRDRKGKTILCETPVDPLYPECSSKMDWMQNFWTSDPCYASYGVDGSNCSFLIYLSEVEDFCPPLAWRNYTQPKIPQKAEEHRPAAFRLDITVLLAALGKSKESLRFMGRRIRRLAPQWATAARRLEKRLVGQWRQEKRILVHMGFLTEDVFSSVVSKGGPLGEMVQWADILTALYVLGHRVEVSASFKDLQGFLGVPQRRNSCPVTGSLPFDLIYTDYHGLRQMREYMGVSLKAHQCRIRVIDTFGTEPAYNNKLYAVKNGYRSNWGHWNLDCRQYMTMFPHTPDNSFMGFVADELSKSEKLHVSKNKAKNMVVVYGKDISMWKVRGKEHLLEVLRRHMDVHATVYHQAWSATVMPPFVKNHGLLSQKDLQKLLKKAKVFVGLGFPYEGPAPLEAVANGCIFLQPKFHPPHSSLNHKFFEGKPTSREVTSQHPYMERHIGKPHVMTVNFNNSQELEATIQELLRTKVEPYLPFEYTCEGMLERVHAYIQHQDFCAPTDPLPPASFSKLWPGNPHSPFVLLSNSTRLAWEPSVPAPPSWPPLSSLQALLSQPGLSCTETCRSIAMVCEPTFFHFINSKQALSSLNVRCEMWEVEANHIFPAVSREQRRCSLQKEPLLFSCAGLSARHRRLCPCRDARHGQVALCRDCL
ncbi:alpha-1,6-mannosylglycoprotein 6-beta-N-acetylglucosaminyltransferase B-like [Scleropages formosus]|uniref:alpha-1,6-mannosylglycoprotein 6-beta-N-acetylglucosaminyltransferase B-like n=1 Tax=Scleropages formosus TaxID=113540 RepID=UPI0010FA6EB9|nr:alpha-1,6-mannosylglycoprotein 6-beta-N-acetylglucosaminyltransferase B-like [Scleropages formosus]